MQLCEHIEIGGILVLITVLYFVPSSLLYLLLQSVFRSYINIANNKGTRILIHIGVFVISVLIVSVLIASITMR